MKKYRVSTRKTILAFREYCFWNYEVWCTLKGLSEYRYKKIDFVMYRIFISLHEYWIINVCKLFDSKFTFNNPANVNLTVEYIIEEIKWPQDVRNDLLKLSRKMEAFRGKLRSTRNKIIAHSDLRTHVEASGSKMGGFNKGEDLKYYENLLKFKNIMEHEVFGGPDIGWPEFASSDVGDFCERLRAINLATKEIA